MLRTFVTLICCAASLSWVEAAERPNIVYILADDMGYGDLKDDASEAKNVAEQNPELVKELSNLLAKAIRNGRTTDGAIQANDGWPNTTPKRTLEIVPG